VANENWVLGGKGEVDQDKVWRAKLEEEDVKLDDMIRSQVVGMESSMLEVLCRGCLFQLGTTGR
jgi:hypothetical protein